MLRVLLASQPVRAGWLGGTTFSTVTHGALIAIAVVATNTTVSTVREHRAADAVERITYVEPARLMDAMRAAKAKKVMRAKPQPAPVVPDFTAIANAISATIQVPDITAAPDLTAVTDAWADKPIEFGSTPGGLAGIILAKAGLVAPANGIYTEDMVDHSVVARRGNPKPRYPSSLADNGVEGDFIVRFVVDSTGAVPDDKIEFPSTMHRLFAAAVRTALLRSRYSPAQSGGRFVAQQVVQEFRFTIADRRR